MPAPSPIPKSLTNRPFTRETGLQEGLTPTMFRGRRLVRLFPQVWVYAHHVMSDRDWIDAACLAMPPEAQLAGISRIQALGLSCGSLRPFHFVVRGDLHLDLPGIFLHRTVVLPPTDDVGLTPAAAFVMFSARARVIDAIKVGDWLLHHQHMTLLELRELAGRDRWRPGAREALWVSRHLDDRSRSPKESETRAVLTFAGLPEPEPNRGLTIGSRVVAYGDLTYLRWNLVVEYEGSQHLLDREQWNSDIERYAMFRQGGLRYVQVTKEKLAKPRTLVSEVYRQLLVGGYQGPLPVFSDRWYALFGSISLARTRRR